MADSVLDIKVDDTEFKAFNDAFDKYNTKLMKMPSAWAGASKEQKQMDTAFKSMTAALLAQSEILRKESREQKVFSDHARNTEISWAKISGHAKSFASSIANSTRNFIKTAGLASAIGGLAGIGGGYLGFGGLVNLANSAAAGRRSSSGLGLSYGEQQSFGLSYGRLINTDSFVGGVNQGRTNIAGPEAVALSILGVTPGGSTADTASQALARVRELTKSTSSNQLGVLQQTHQLGALGLSSEDLQRIKGLSDSEFSEYSSDYSKRRGQLNVQDPTLRKWQDFTVQLETAGERIKTVLIDGLSALAPGLTKLSDGLANVIQSLLGSKTFKDGISALAGVLDDFATYIQKEDFKRDLKDLVSGIGSLARAVGDALRFLGVLPGSSTTGPASLTKEQWDKNTEKWLTENPTFYNTEEKRQRFRDLQNNDYIKLHGITPTSAAANDPLMNLQRSGMEKYMSATAGIESGGRYDAIGPDTGGGHRAYGKYQVMDFNIGPWSKQYAGRQMNIQEFVADKAAQEAVYRGKFGEYLATYGNAADAYSMWHSGRPFAQAKAEGAHDKNMTTEEYVRRSLAATATRVVVEDKTGGNVNISSTAMGYPQ